MAQEDLERLIRKLDDQINGAEGAQKFSKKEAEELRQMIAIFRMMIGWGKLGRALIWIFMTAAGVLLTWEQVVKSGSGQ